ncbi:MAG: YbhB/YbcL family Raf kinase inhibitor-like protein [candidate division WOR-3 bacterium]|nr:YbhB/YbcL family Raf kinase inhibitor-like protein [candidate division WOR-3 bacterium]MCX7947176.1 YbhB/YbcL family Raf kinase inhibitor-like protein [candidate division WOR-3 bacterium]
MKVYSNSFKEKENIPIKYTCEGENISPHVRWEEFPKETKSFVLIMSDPDAPFGTFYHWILYDIPNNIGEIKEGESIGKKGKNDFGKLGYGGPCPPRGHGKHRYYITIYALNVESLGIKEGASAKEVLKAIEGKIIAKGEFYGIYERK